jgi:hypothetical protein
MLIILNEKAKTPERNLVFRISVVVCCGGFVAPRHRRIDIAFDGARETWQK